MTSSDGRCWRRHIVFQCSVGQGSVDVLGVLQRRSIITSYRGMTCSPSATEILSAVNQVFNLAVVQGSAVSCRLIH